MYRLFDNIFETAEDLRYFLLCEIDFVKGIADAVKEKMDDKTFKAFGVKFEIQAVNPWRRLP